MIGVLREWYHRHAPLLLPAPGKVVLSVEVSAELEADLGTERTHQIVEKGVSESLDLLREAEGFIGEDLEVVIEFAGLNLARNTKTYWAKTWATRAPMWMRALRRARRWPLAS